jgi:GNAT superfamily N-acetyltransferase
VKTRLFWKNKHDTLPDEFFVLERDCFSERYTITPNTKREFDAMFRCKSLIGEARFDDMLIGMLFLDELLESELYYLRVICVYPQFRRKGFSTELLKNALKNLGGEYIYLAFVTETEQLKRMVSKIGGSFCEYVPKNITNELCKYNPKLTNEIPGTYIDQYYMLKNGIEVKGFYSIFLFR